MSESASDLGTDLVAVAMNLAVDAATVEIVGAFQAAGVPCIVLKGPALAEWLYESEPSRHSVDVDLFVGSGVLPAAEDALREIGYRPLVPVMHSSDRPRYARVWHRDPESANVDLHTTLAGVGVSSDEAWRVLSGETEPRAVGPIRADILSPAARALHLALHAAWHGAEYSRAVRDLERGLERLPLAVWQKAAALAVRLDAMPAFATALAFVPEGQELVRRFELSGAGSVEAALRAQTAPPLALGLEWFSGLPGPGAKIRFVAGKLLPSRAFMRRWHPLARRGRIGLIVAYAYRPLWLLLKLGPAVVVWRRAKKASARDR